MTTETTIAGTILNQLGGSKFITMTGAKSFLNLGDGLQFRIPTSKGINSVRITLKHDLYQVSFHKIKGLEFDTVEAHFGVYVDNLRDLFTRVTGLVTSL